MNNSHKPLPQFDSEDEEREFWATHDSTEYVDWSKADRNSAFPHLKPSTRTSQLCAYAHFKYNQCPNQTDS